ncbi:cytokine receptor common subunit beta-like [Spea bombifrons]|uniref:cytokine receptor common subunit beta-like n=1 Tax=Spea bombifrons TaxID=233779 RepID=UPI002349C0B7|nr:cytokine receptor common subunit beta-like [Spea bombifrons]
MRVKTGGSWSKWSSEIQLEPRRPGDEAKSQNLQCFLSDIKLLTCTWTQRVEVTDSVSFQLYHKQKESSMEHSCHPRCKQLLPNLPHLACQCSISLEDENTLPTISIRTVEEVKSFRPCIHINIPPRNLTIKEVNNGEAYTASWHTKEPTEKPEFKLQFELCYWTEDEPPLNEVSSDCPRNPDKLSLSQYPEVVLTLGEQLKPLRTYHAKLRMRVADEDPKDCFQGPWSQWSSIQTWKTKSVTSYLIRYITIIVCSIIFIIVCAFGYKRLVRYKKQWDEIIPDPGKSKHIVDFQREMNRSTSISPEHYFYEEITSRFSAVSDSAVIGSKDIGAVKGDEEQNNQTYRLQSYDNNTYLFSPTQPGSKNNVSSHHSSDLETNVKCEIPNFSLCSFNGPYLLFPSNTEESASTVDNINTQVEG